MTTLHEAARSGALAAIEHLLAAGTKVDGLDGRGRTPLSYAADAATVERLLAAGADPLMTAIHETRELRPVDFAFRLPTDAVVPFIARGILPAPRPDDECRIIDAARRLHLPALRALLGAGLRPLHRADASNALHLLGEKPEGQSVTFDRQRRAIEALVAAGCDLEQRNAHGRTPLHVSVDELQVERAHALLLCGARTDATVRGQTATYLLHRVRAIPPAEEERLLGPAENVLGPGEIWPRAMERTLRIRSLRQLFRKHEIPRKMREPETLPPLIDAIGKNDEAEIRGVLRKHPKSVHMSTRDGERAIHFCAHGTDASDDRHHLFDLLFEHGADLEARNGWGGNALHIACHSGSAAMVSWLLDAGADTESTFRHGSRALHAATMHPDTPEPAEKVRLLLEANADRAAPSGKARRRTPLECAERSLQEAQSQWIAKGRPRSGVRCEQVQEWWDVLAMLEA